MTLETKDIIYLVTYIISLMGVLLSIRSRLNNLEKKYNYAGKIIYGERGKLNVIDLDTCKKHRDEVFTSIRRAETVSEMLVQEIKKLNDNVTK